MDDLEPKKLVSFEAAIAQALPIIERQATQGDQEALDWLSIYRTAAEYYAKRRA